ncbi:hypothetical protein KXD40_000804 [Peronospora effusa]|nr:hypothetical protein KXD40_000804 [Peronospora effusa]
MPLEPQSKQVYEQQLYASVNVLVLFQAILLRRRKYPHLLAQAIKWGAVAVLQSIGAVPSMINSYCPTAE